MDRIIPILITIGVIVLGFIIKCVEIINLNKRWEFTCNYRSKFIDLCNDIAQKDHFDQKTYYELTSEVKDMQEELGIDGVYAYAKDNLTGIATRDYQLLVNFLPELRTAVTEKRNSIMAMRLNKSMSDCDDMFIRHMGTLTSRKDAVQKQKWNPFSCFAEGVRAIVFFPILLLFWFGIINKTTSLKVKQNWFIKVFNVSIILVGFVGSIITIVIGWEQFSEIVQTLL